MGARRHRRKLLIVCRTRADRRSRPKGRARQYAGWTASGADNALILVTGFIILLKVLRTRLHILDGTSRMIVIRAFVPGYPARAQGSHSALSFDRRALFRVVLEQGRKLVKSFNEANLIAARMSYNR